MTKTAEVVTSSVSTETWEPLIEDGRKLGETHLLRQEEGGPVVGLWRISVEDGAEFPYNVTGTDSFHVIEGEAELETPTGEKIQLTPGGVYSFPDGFSATWRTRSAFMKFFVIA